MGYVSKTGGRTFNFERSTVSHSKPKVTPKRRSIEDSEKGKRKFNFERNNEAPIHKIHVSNNRTTSVKNAPKHKIHVPKSTGNQRTLEPLIVKEKENFDHLKKGRKMGFFKKLRKKTKKFLKKVKPLKKLLKFSPTALIMRGSAKLTKKTFKLHRKMGKKFFGRKRKSKLYSQPSQVEQAGTGDIANIPDDIQSALDKNSEDQQVEAQSIENKSKDKKKIFIIGGAAVAALLGMFLLTRKK